MSKRIPALRALAVAAAGAAAFTFSAAAVAQETAAPVERIEVTGSLIKRIEGETALPVSVVTKDEIQKSGATTVEELMTQLPLTTSAGATTSSQNAGATTGGLTGISLHGLGSTRVLVLINGRRVAPYGIVTDSTSVDVNSLPVSAIERVEVLKEGASAIYGSDAIGGVVNFILRQDYQGAEISANYGETKEGGGGSKGVSLVYGYGDLHKDRFNFMVTAGYQQQDPLWGSQRGFAANGLSQNTINFGYDATSRNTYPGAITPVSGTGIVPATTSLGRVTPGFPGCAPSSFDTNFDTGNAYAQCRFDPSPYVPLIDKAQHANVFASLKFQVTDSMLAYAEASFNRNIINNREQPSPVSSQFALPNIAPYQNPLSNLYPYNEALFGGAATPGPIATSRVILNPLLANGSVNNNYPFAYMAGYLNFSKVPGANTLALPGTGAGTGGALTPAQASQYPMLNVNYRTFLNGDRDLTDSTQTPRVTLGVKGTVFDWDYDVNVLHSSNEVTERDNEGYWIQSKLLPILNSGAINLMYPGFGAAPTDAQIAQMRATNFTSDAWINRTYLDSVQAKVSSDLFTLPGGPAGVALGAEFRREKFEESTSPYIQRGDISGYGGNILPTAKQRNVYATFGELDVPILKGVEADAAVRFDHYEGTGSKINPKIGLRFQPFSQILLRGSYSKGFRAPSLTDLFAPNVQTVTTTLTDPLDCVGKVGFGCQAQFTGVLGGNAQLKPERSTNLSLGIVLQPTKNLSASVDYFDIKIKDVIAQGGLPVQFILANLNTWGYLVTRSTTPDPLLPGSFPITLINELNINVGAQRNQGFDANFNWGIPMGEWGKTTLGLDATYFQRVVIQNPDNSWTDQIDTALQTLSASGGMIPRWKHVARVDWTRGDWDVLVVQHYQGTYTDLNGPGGNVVEAYYTYDTNVSYTGLKNWRLSLGVINVANQDPPYTGAGGNLYFQNGFDPSYADPRGRFIYGTVTYRIK
jgi:iron complex outermembrane receptor protein